MQLDIAVYAKIGNKKIECKILTSFQHKITEKSYVIVFSPFETTPVTIIPLIFDPDINIQEASFLSDKQDISVIEEIINKKNCQIQYLPVDNMTFELQVSHTPIQKIGEALKELASNHFVDHLHRGAMDKLIKDIDAKIIHLTGEEYFSEIEKNKDNRGNDAIGLIIKILEQNVSLTHISLNIIEDLLASQSIKTTIQEKRLFKAFQEVITALGKNEIIRQEIENSLVSLTECEICTKELYENIINHNSFLERISRDVLEDIKYNVILRNPSFFDIDAYKSSANYFYSKKEYDNALKMYNFLYQKLNNSSIGREIAITLNSIGCCCVSLMRFSEAYDAFKQATNIDDHFAVAYNNLAYTLSIEASTLNDKNKRYKKLQEALVYINDAIQLNSCDVSFISNRAYIEYELGQYEHVIKDYFRAKEKSPEYKDISTILKLKIDSKLKLYINSPAENTLMFSDLSDDLQTIFENENGKEQIYFEAFEVFNDIKNNEEPQVSEYLLLNLVLLEFYIDELLSAISVRNPNQEIYYYTNMNSLHMLFCDEKASVKHRLPIFCVNHMNDPSEGQEFKKAFLVYGKENNFLKDLFHNTDNISNSKRKSLMADFTFLKAFTKNDDSLPMWIHYADSGNGCCVKIDSHFFTNFDSDLFESDKTLKNNPFDNEYRLYEVLYIKNGKIVNSISSNVKKLFENIIDKSYDLGIIYDNLAANTKKAVISAMSKMVVKLQYLFKSSDYAYEQEMRIVLRRQLEDFQRDDIDIQLTAPSSNSAIPKAFIYSTKSLPIEEIILGPKVVGTDNLIPFLTMKLMEMNNYDLENVHITKSGIEYR